MSEERPIGWRPFSAEYRQSLVDSGLTEEDIAKSENKNAYSPDATAVRAYEFSRAITKVLHDWLGEEFAVKLRAELQRRAGHLAASDDGEDLVEAPMVAALSDAGFWDGLITTTSPSAPERRETDPSST